MIKKKNVCFVYDDMEVLHNLSFTAEANEMTAFVGPSGSGKSTVARLIASFWEAGSGTVKIGGTDVRNMPLSQIMEYVAYVSQDNYLFHLSVRENIRLGSLMLRTGKLKRLPKKHPVTILLHLFQKNMTPSSRTAGRQIGRASCRERV